MVEQKTVLPWLKGSGKLVRQRVGEGRQAVNWVMLSSNQAM